MTLLYRNYKEPLKKVEQGYGYYGTVATDDTGNRLQCHICGELFEQLGPHIFQSHGMKVADYKLKFQLNRTTSLVGEDVRRKLIKNYQNYSQAVADTLKKGRSAPKTKRDNKWRLEQKNILGTCPDQLLDKIKKLSIRLGHTPSNGEFRRFYKGKYSTSILNTFGTWNAAIELAGLARNEGSKYSDEVLLSFLQNFYQQHNRVPTTSDFNRNYLPSSRLYIYRFGSLNQARMAANIPILIPMSNGKYVETMEY